MMAPLSRVLACAGALLFCAEAWAHAASEHDAKPPAAARPVATAASAQPAATEEASRNYFTDRVLLTQQGDPVRFYSDVLKDRVVLINFVYTSCKDACPLITFKLNQVRRALGESFGKDVRFVSISIDPERDTPAALREFAAKQDAEHPGWLFLTGDRADVEVIVKKLGQYTPDPQTHSTLVLAGNVKTRHWAKVPPMATVDAIVLRLRTFLSEL